ncbi:MAG: transposase [Candidatus Micrarchaeota archaeon]
MILAFKIKHNHDFSAELSKARKIAEIGIKTRTDSSRDVRHIGLSSTIANQILRKYGGNRKAKHASSIKLVIPNQAIRVNKKERTIFIPPLKKSFYYHFKNSFEKINQIEIDNQYFYVSASFKEEPLFEPKGWVGVDLNTSGHSVVAVNQLNGKVLKMGKQFTHIRRKYKDMRTMLQKRGKHRQLKKIKDRESRILKDLNHKISSKLVDYALGMKFGIKFEKLDGIWTRGRRQRKHRHLFHSWSFYQFQKMVDYKAKMKGVPIEYVSPQYTSLLCSRCEFIGNRSKKMFKCPICGHVDNADVNAAFNIAKRQEGIYRLRADRDARKGNTGIPKEAMA